MAFGAFLEGAEVATRRGIDFLAFEQLGNGKNLDSRVLGVPRDALVEAGAGGFLAHRRGRVFHRNEQADRGIFPLDHAAQVPDVGWAGLAGLHGNDDLLRLGRLGFVVEKDAAIDASVRALLLFHRPGVDQPERPPLKLVRIFGGQCGRVGHGNRLADHFVGFLDRFPVSRVQAVLHQGNCQIGDVNSDPFPAESLGHRDGRAAATERVEHHVALVAARLDDALQQGFRLLRGVAKTFGGLRIDWERCR